MQYILKKTQTLRIVLPILSLKFSHKMDKEKKEGEKESLWSDTKYSERIFNTVSLLGFFSLCFEFFVFISKLSPFPHFLSLSLSLPLADTREVNSQMIFLDDIRGKSDIHEQFYWKINKNNSVFSIYNRLSNYDECLCIWGKYRNDKWKCEVYERDLMMCLTYCIHLTILFTFEKSNVVSHWQMMLSQGKFRRTSYTKVLNGFWEKEMSFFCRKI